VLAIGLMSGTSLDGVDAALVELDGDRADSLRWRVVAFETTPYQAHERDAIHDAIRIGRPEELCRLHASLGEWFATAALRVCEGAGVDPADVDAIGSHGQTIWHQPPGQERRGYTLQLGDASTIAERTGIAVVHDFRSRDMAAGGHGAPLVAWPDRALFAAPDRVRVLLNLGGIANLSRVPRTDSDERLIAFDTGPGNALIDAAVELATHGLESFDREGARAGRGKVDRTLLEHLLTDPFFLQDPPKSTGRERFGRPLVERIVERVDPVTQEQWDALIATLTTLTAESTCRAVRQWVQPLGADEVFVSGGGAHNTVLMDMLRERLDPLPVETSAAIGVDPDAKEALAFAVLAWAFLNDVPANVPSVTGSEGPRVLGSYTPGRP